MVILMKLSRQLTVLILITSLTLLVACGKSETMPIQSEADISGGGADATSPLYVIGPGDSLHVFVWGDNELSTEVVVRPDGLITTPLVEDLPASGKTPTELARTLEERLSRFVKNPKVTVSVTNFVGRYTEQVRVVGQAAQPQSLPYRDGMTLLDVIISVGGLTEFAAGNKATIVRKINGKTQQYRVRLDDLIRDGDISANTRMMPGDVLIIPETWF